MGGRLRRLIGVRGRGGEGGVLRHGFLGGRTGSLELSWGYTQVDDGRGEILNIARRGGGKISPAFSLRGVVDG